MLRPKPRPVGENAGAVIDLSKAPGSKESWGKPLYVVALWSACELVFVTNPWQISSRLRVAVLRAFGAEVADGVIFRPRTRVKAPWKLHIGPRSWIGEGVWFHNQDDIWIGADVVISQETFLTTGSHRVRTDMGLVTSPIRVDDGAWVTSRCMVLGGTRIGKSAVIQPMTVVKGTVPPGQVFGSAVGPTGLGERFVSAAESSNAERKSS
ncbi:MULTISPECIES: acetyltransferase [unclassified Arthrobacter]|uniref:acetyltransferase n=1 Tax=unclassified Arthrobacter TaxID=235627 RepID=UPI0021068C84|nr:MULTISPECIES: acetyltransferase [unclassified Arthrobacter]MCQ1947839.1 acetyltransferase [Arthrobacter sp. zg-Y1116]MCQ1987778.1 acetyltransferase [Arthrobacter sp. zg-Y844]MCQ1996257.1 acetyltransferase [Arthrobacter sp. zg-Y1171]UWX82692.1 acetyltransferase [Arthrobacter sp. zg-Y1171]